jgi:hypothetical protein
VRICPGGPEDCDGTAGWYTVNRRGGCQPDEAIELNLALENLSDEC